tara:strand:- start:6284 stop:7501 length:1218 start_codon:yes stop_codon:yes gene_type:complete
MTNKRALFTRTLTLFLLAMLTFLAACKTSTDPDPEPPIEPEPIERVGTKELTINVINRDDETDLTGFSIEIEGPVTASETNVSTAQFTLSDVVSGEYTITVSRSGFVNSQVTEELEVPEEVSSDYNAETTISMRATTPPVQVTNNEDSTVQTGQPDEEDAEEDEAVTLQIPANTFPANVVKEDGTVDISVTRAKPSEAQQSDEGLVAESLILTPEAELNNPVTITIPIRDIAGLEDAEYVLQPGNIPISRDGSGNLVATITPDRSTSDGFDQTSNFNGLSPIRIFRQYRVTIPNYRVTETDGFTDFRLLSSQCGQALNVNYDIPGVTIPILIQVFGNDYRRFRTNRFQPVTVAAVPNRIVTIQARNATRTLTLTRGNTEVSTVTVNRAVVQTANPITVACHNSGG